MTALGYGILAAAIVLCAAAVWCERRKTRRTLEKLNEMLTDAMRGDFTEDSFDETLLSALESKLAHYLAASTVSARNVSTEKEKLKTLIGDISHQTKTPIANILLYAQLLREQPGNTVCLDALDAQTRKLQSLIDALVKTSRLESGVIALRPEPGALQDVLSSAVSQLEPKAGEKGISITFLPTDAEAVFDAKWTEEAVFNLLDNAVKYNKDGGLVIVRLGEEKGQAVLTVTDTGIGISPEHQERVFERFYRVDKSHSKEIGGTGLGLSIVKHAALILGAAIELDSTVGKGTIVMVRFPMEKK